jgi:streptogrisin C
MIAAVLAITPAGAAQAGGGSESEDFALEGEEAMRVTAQGLADSSGITLEQALEVFEHQETMDQLQEQIRDLDPANYGGAVHDELPKIGMTIYVKDVMPDGATELLAGHDNVKLAVSEFSLSDMESLSNSARDALVSLGVKDFSTGADMRTHSIAVEVANAELARLNLDRSDLLEGLGLDGAAVRLTLVDGTVANLAHSYGGGQLRDGTFKECTSGFVVEKISNGVDGVLTAAHCSGLDTYEETSGNDYDTSYQGAALSSLGDVEWQTTDHTEYDNFYYTNTATIDVTGLKNHLYMDVGDSVCSYGRKSAKNLGCEEINQLFVSASGYSSMFRTDPNGLKLGDSGGPWYVSGTAWGITNGWFNSNLDAIFSAVSIVDGNMGVSLRTS